MPPVTSSPSPGSPAPISSGVLFAVLAAITFGVTTPAVAWAGQAVGPLTTAALLYAGACFSALALRLVTPASGAPLKTAHLGRLVAVAFFGAAAAPTLFAWGLQRSGATTGSLLLNLESLFTVLLARAFYREPVGRRVAVALPLMVVAGALLALDGARGAHWNALGSLAIAAATLAWALDNTLTRPLAEQDPGAIVAAKGGMGAVATGTLALVLGEGPPSASAVLALLACGATGYGISLRLYLLAQRRMGAARTGSVFAVAPFVGAAVAWALGGRAAGPLTGASAGLFAIGVFLHATERHAHRHAHRSVEHEHTHRHDDLHHTHVHQPPIVGPHTHPHGHDRLEHEHPHAPDLHHDHDHDQQ